MGGDSSSFSGSTYRWSSDDSVTKKSAKSYAKDDKREYKASKVGLPSLVGREFSSKAEKVGSIILDVTGSMQELPGLFVLKAPAVYAESNAAVQGKRLKELEKGAKLEDALELSVIAIGDARGDTYPIQGLDYCKGQKLVEGVQGIFPEGGGGGNKEESYDLGAYYLLNHSETPNVPKGAKPFLIIIGDEGFYPKINADWVKKYTGDDLPRDLDTKSVLEELGKKFDTYVLRPEGYYDEATYAVIHKQWVDVFGPQRVMKMNGYDRFIDCIVGICGYAADNFASAEEMLRRRQRPEQVDEVLEILHPILSSPKTPAKKPRKKVSKTK